MVNPRIHLFFFFFSREADERNPPCNERLHSVAGAGGTAASSVVRKLAVSTRCFWYPPRLPNCVENCTVIRQKVNIVFFFFPTAGAGLFFFFGHRSGASFLLCAYVSSPPPPSCPMSVTNCRVGCQRAALHFEDDSQWHGAFDPSPRLCE